jgi:hypothetical protein
VLNTDPVIKTRKPRAKKSKAEEEKIGATENQSTDIGPLRKMYVMKFNTPILPYSKFPLT